MFPPISTLKQLSERPEGIIPTGRIGGDGKWMITQFKGPSEAIVYKYQRFDWAKRGNVFMEEWYSEM